jgi:ferrous-iron efflux pump FieF
MSPGHKHHHSIFLHGKPVPERHRVLKSWATYASVSVGLILVCLKTYGWHLTGSVSLLSSLADSFLDLVSSIINLFAVHHAMRPADSAHRFGHGKLESLAASIQSIIIIFSSIFIVIEAIDHLKHPQLMTQTLVGLYVMILSVILASSLVTFQLHVIRVTKSIAIKADSMHYRADLYINLAIIIALGFTHWLHWTWMDPLFGFVIALYIIRTAVHILKESLNILMDEELPETDRQQIIDLIMSHPKVVGFHQLRTRSSGTGEFIQVHVEMLKTLSFEQAHVTSHEVEAMLLEEYPQAEVIIHQDPEDAMEPHAHKL